MGDNGKRNHCNLSKEGIEWINGELLGDGCLQSRSKYSAQFTYTSKHLKYCEYVKNTLEFFGILGGKINKRYHKNLGNITYHYRSLCYPELLVIRKKWYPKGKKIVPKNIELTPLICRQWYIGDGSLLHQEKKRPHLYLATNGFTILDVEWLVKQLIKLGFKTTRQPALNIVSISVYSTKSFLNYIGVCPVECYSYKWNY